MNPSSATTLFQQRRLGVCIFVLVSSVGYIRVNLLPLCPGTDADHKAPGLWYQRRILVRTLISVKILLGYPFDEELSGSWL